MARRRSAWDDKKKSSFPKPGMKPSPTVDRNPVVKGRENVIFEPNVLANGGNAEGTLVAMDGVWAGESTNEPQTPDQYVEPGLKGLRQRQGA